MKDIIILVIVPVILITILIIFIIKKNIKIANSNALKDRIYKVSRRRRVIKDVNERKYDTKYLMQPENTKDFDSAMKHFIKQSYKIEVPFKAGE